MKVDSGKRKRPINYKSSTESLNKRSTFDSVDTSRKKKSTRKPVDDRVDKLKADSRTGEVFTGSVNSGKTAKGKHPSGTPSKKSGERSSPKTKSRKQKKKKRTSYSNLPKISVGRILLIILTAIFNSCLMVLLIYGFYMNQIKYPEAMEVDDKTTGIYCIHNWQDAIDNLDGGISDLIEGEESYLQKEVDYANGDEDKLEFIKNVISTVKYTPSQTEGVNKYGNVLIDRNDNIVYVDSDVKEGESVALSYVDYSSVNINVKKIKGIMSEMGITTKDVDYSNKIVDVFCKYMNSFEKLPIKNENDYVPNMVKTDNGTFTMTQDEDIYLDNTLFASDDFRQLMLDFSVAASSSGKKNPEWEKWNKLSKKEKKKAVEPSKTIDELQPTKEWTKWSKLKKDKREEVEEPEKYDSKYIMNMLWCGSHYLLNGYTITDSNGNLVPVSINAQKGNGTFEDPAGLDTEVITYIRKREKNKKTNKYVTKDYPIKLKLVEKGYSQDAIDWFESKDARNRGLDVKSELQYGYFVFEVINLSSKKLKVFDNFSLCDRLANLSPRTGSIYGLKSSVTLKPEQSGKVEIWVVSTELNKKYLIWGADFGRKLDPVWFRVLAGDIDDTTEEKGVTINDSRQNKFDEDSSNDSSSVDD